MRSKLAASSLALATVCVVVGVLSSVSTSVAATWSVQTAANPGGVTSTFAQVSCSAGAEGGCVAVGNYEDSKNVGHAFSETWGSSKVWTLRSLPLPTGALASALYAVSCTSFTACTAVGKYVNSEEGHEKSHILAERWNGTAWSVQSTSAAIEASTLTGVSCTTATACTAVGEYDDFPSGETTFAEVWNGTAWSFQETAGFLAKSARVSCTSATACTLVGTITPGGLDNAATERWNGTKWASQTPVNPERQNVLHTVSCAALTRCIAVGAQKGEETPSKTLAEIWNGTSWATQETTNPEGENNELRGVSCPSTTACVAVGITDAKDWLLGGGNPMAESWNGTKWTSLSVPKAAEAKETALDGVSCTTVTTCTAVGGYTTSSEGLAPAKVLVERYE